ncbi:MAG: dTMP kinase [Pseudomonadota bacterium]
MASAPDRGFFVTFEGGDGVGKSTHIRRLAAHLRARGVDVVETREPGGAPGAEEVRALLVRGNADRWSPKAEALLMFAARAEHLEKTILPAVTRGAVVLCDRFVDSTMAYQGIAGGLGVDMIDALNDLVVGDDGPSLTFILHAGEGEGLSRTKERSGDETRFESKGAAFQAAVVEGFFEIARRHPERCVLIDTSGDVDAVSDAITRAFDAHHATRKARR